MFSRSVGYFGSSHVRHPSPLTDKQFANKSVALVVHQLHSIGGAENLTQPFCPDTCCLQMSTSQSQKVFCILPSTFHFSNQTGCRLDLSAIWAVDGECLSFLVRRWCKLLPLSLVTSEHYLVISSLRVFLRPEQITFLPGFSGQQPSREVSAVTWSRQDWTSALFRVSVSVSVCVCS